MACINSFFTCAQPRPVFGHLLVPAFGVKAQTRGGLDAVPTPFLGFHPKRGEGPRGGKREGAV